MDEQQKEWLDWGLRGMSMGFLLFALIIMLAKTQAINVCGTQTEGIKQQILNDIYLNYKDYNIPDNYDWSEYNINVTQSSEIKSDNWKVS